MRAALIPVITLIYVTANSTPVVNPATGNSYDVVLVAGKTWNNAQADADSSIFAGVFGHLATITSVEERNFIFRLLRGIGPGKLWIGAFQDQEPPCPMEPAGCWTWVNGEGLFVYTDWGPGQPDNNGGNQHHAAITLGSNQWTDEDGSQADADIIGYLVEYDSSTTAATNCIFPNSCNLSGAKNQTFPANTNAGPGDTVTSGLLEEDAEFDDDDCPGPWSFRDPRVSVTGHVIPAEIRPLDVGARTVEDVPSVFLNAETYGSPCFTVELTEASFFLDDGVVNTLLDCSGVPGIGLVLGCTANDHQERARAAYQTTIIGDMLELSAADMTNDCINPSRQAQFQKSFSFCNVHEDFNIVFGLNGGPEAVLAAFQDQANAKFELLRQALENAELFLESPKIVILRRETNRAQSLLKKGHFPQSGAHLEDLLAIVQGATWTPSTFNHGGHVEMRVANLVYRLSQLEEAELILP